jgi:4-amino-4-deoxy-L-arabinose transferase-like glycosyltransferase
MFSATFSFIGLMKQIQVKYSSAKLQFNYFYLLLIILLLAATGQILFVMKLGIGLSPDSITYITVAKRIASGHGVTLASGEPLTHYPPLYPLALAFTGFLSTEFLYGAKLFHALLYCANICAVFLLIYRDTRTWFPSILGMLLTMSSAVMMYIHTMAWSEPLFVLLVLLCFLCLSEYLTTSKRVFFFVAAFFISLALLVRYAGVAFVIAGILALFILPRNRTSLYRKSSDMLLFCVIAISPLSVWVIKNKMFSGTFANRTFEYHLIPAEHLHKMINTFSAWFNLPDNMTEYSKSVFLCGIGLAAFIILLLLLKKQPGYSKRENIRMPYTPLISGLFMVAYILFLLVSISFFDVHTPLDHRILAPVFTLIVVGGFTSIYKLARVYKFSVKINWILSVLVLISIALQLKTSIPLAFEWSEEGRGYASSKWKNSKTLSLARSLPPEITVFSNKPEALVLLADREAKMIPNITNPQNRKRNPNFYSEIESMLFEMIQENAVLVYFNIGERRYYLPKSKDIESNLPLDIIYKGYDGAIYKAKKKSE